MSLKSYLNKDLIECGVDESGRGSLAGPVFAAAVILPKDFTSENIKDSKKLTEKGVKVVFRHKKVKKEKKDEEEKSKYITDFGNILAELVNKSKNINLIRAYEYIINNKKLEEDDILII